MTAASNPSRQGRAEESAVTKLSGGNRSSRPKVMLPETGVMLPEIHCHVARNPESYRPKYYRVWSSPSGCFMGFEFDGKIGVLRGNKV